MEKTPDSEQPKPPTAALPQPDAVPETREPTIHLDQFLKTCGVPTGGQVDLDVIPLAMTFG